MTGRIAMRKLGLGIGMAVLTLGSVMPLQAQTTNNSPDLQQNGPTRITLKLDQANREVSPMLYGLMTEEINHSYDGGLYAEIIRNRAFMDDFKQPVYWQLRPAPGATASMELDRKVHLNDASRVSLRLEVTSDAQPVKLVNDGYWGVPVRPATVYKGFFYAKAGTEGTHQFRVSIERDSMSPAVFAETTVSSADTGWHKYRFELKTGDNTPVTADAKFMITTDQKGAYWFGTCSLFPPTFNNRPNGNRPDIMQLLYNMKPAFLRLPGGNFLEGGKFSSRYDWKKTLGPIEDRPGHMGTWGYRSTDGMGLLEYLEWCEDLNCEPLLAVFAGYTLGGDHLEGPLLQPFIDEALEEIEYVIGDTTTKWGARRARDGHPQPFPLKYVEIGNEDFFDRSGSYQQRFAQFYTAIKEKYPELVLISTFGKDFDVKGGQADMIDDHFYRNAADFEADADHYDKYDRNGPKVLVGEWATREGSPTPNFNAALGDAVWLTGLERNSDVVLMSCYAPLFVNVNPGGMQWESDLIGYNVLNAYGSPSYYVQRMFSNHIGDKVIPITIDGISTQLEQLNDKDKEKGRKPRVLPTIFCVATKDSKKSKIYLKVVNTLGRAQRVNFKVEGGNGIKSRGAEITLQSDDPKATNSITDPTHIIPVKSDVKGLGSSFSRTLPPYSITVYELDAKK